MKVMQFFEVGLLMDICRKYKLFTAGTDEEYGGLYRWNNKPYTDESLFEIAEYIKGYSDDTYAIEDIAGTILREGIIRYIEN
jgi:hypothetical protein